MTEIITDAESRPTFLVLAFDQKFSEPTSEGRRGKSTFYFPALFSYLGFLSRSISLTQLEPELNLSKLFYSFRSIPFRFLQIGKDAQTDLTH